MDTGASWSKEEGAEKPRKTKKTHFLVPHGLRSPPFTPTLHGSSTQDGWQSGRSRTLGKRVYLYR